MTKPRTSSEEEYAFTSHRVHTEAAVLREMIRSIAPDKSGAGKRFLIKLLDARGPEGVEAFIEKLQQATTTRTDPPLDAVERELLRSTYLKVMDRRVFMDCLRWGMLGATFTGISAFSLADQAYRSAYNLSSPERDKKYDSPFTPTRDWIEKNISTPLGFAIGVNWVYDAYEKWHSIKLDEVVRATDRLGQAMKAEAAAKGPQAG